MGTVKFGRVRTARRVYLYSLKHIPLIYFFSDKLDDLLQGSTSNLLKLYYRYSISATYSTPEKGKPIRTTLMGISAYLIISWFK
jgi:hypothetical protein